MKKFIALVAVLVFFASLTISGFCNVDAEKQVKAFYTCMQKGDIDNMLALISDDILEQITKSSGPEGIGHDLGLAVGVTGAIKEKVLSVQISNLKLKTTKEKEDGSVEVVAEYTVKITKDGKSETEEAKDTLSLKLQNDKWVIFDLQQ